MSGDFWIAFLNITLFVWLISFALATWVGEIESMIAFGFVVLFTYQMIIEHRIKEE